MSARDLSIQNQIRDVLDSQLNLTELPRVGDAALVLHEASVAEARDLARADQRWRFGISLLFFAPISAGCAFFLPALDWFRWVFLALTLLYAAVGIRQMGKANAE